MLKVIDRDKRMSESLLWTLQQNAYEQFGAAAWTQGLVPSYITSNPYIAKQYAQQVIAYLRDLKELDTDHPLYVLDIGAGSGRFAYLFLITFLEIVPTSLPVKLCYVMTDITEDTFDFWQAHPYLRPYFEQGILDFALYHHTQEKPELLLRRSGKIISPETAINPLVVIANYFFDTIPQDLFYVRNGHLEEGKVTLSVEEELNLASDDPKNITHLEANYHYAPIENVKNYYADKPVLGEILEHYCKMLKDCPFLFPSGGFQALEFFRKISNDRFLLLAGDQGVSTLAQIQRWGEPKISKHETFSIAVNYHSLAEYFHRAGGMGLLTSMSDPLFVVIVAVMDGTKSDFPKTVNTFTTILDANEPKDIWKMVSLEEDKQLPLEKILLLLKLSNWDPCNFHLFYQRIRDSLPEASALQKEHLYEAIHRTRANFYYVGAEEGDFILNLGVLLFELEHFCDALAYFQHSLSITGEKSQTYSNMGACYVKLQDHTKAEECFDKVKRDT